MRSTVLTLVLLLIGLSEMACTPFVDLKPQGQAVRVVSRDEAKRCKKIGHMTTHTTDEVMGIPRDSESLNDELTRLARNYAGNMGGNAVVALGAAQQGEQSFNVYHCGR